MYQTLPEEKSNITRSDAHSHYSYLCIGTTVKLASSQTIRTGLVPPIESLHNESPRTRVCLASTVVHYCLSKHFKMQPAMTSTCSTQGVPETAASRAVLITCGSDLNMAGLASIWHLWGVVCPWPKEHVPRRHDLEALVLKQRSVRQDMPALLKQAEPSDMASSRSEEPSCT